MKKVITVSLAILLASPWLVSASGYLQQCRYFPDVGEVSCASYATKCTGNCKWVTVTASCMVVLSSDYCPETCTGTTFLVIANCVSNGSGGCACVTVPQSS